jgi:hypothetical protein
MAGYPVRDSRTRPVCTNPLAERILGRASLLNPSNQQLVLDLIEALPKQDERRQSTWAMQNLSYPEKDRSCQVSSES